MFVFSKIVGFFLDPGLWLGALLLGGTIMLWTGWRRVGRWVLTATMMFIAAVTIFPVGLIMTAQLEDRFPVVHDLKGPVDGIIVLGGTIHQLITAYRGQPSLTGGAERLTESVALARRPRRTSPRATCELYGCGVRAGLTIR